MDESTDPMLETDEILQTSFSIADMLNGYKECGSLIRMPIKEKKSDEAQRDKY